MSSFYRIAGTVQSWRQYYWNEWNCHCGVSSDSSHFDSSPFVGMSFVQVLVLGQGDVGQLGLGESMVERKRPYPVKGLEGHKVVQVVCGGMHTAALTDKGKVCAYQKVHWCCFCLFLFSLLIMLAL